MEPRVFLQFQPIITAQGNDQIGDVLLFQIPWVSEIISFDQHTTLLVINVNCSIVVCFRISSGRVQFDVRIPV